MVDVGLQVVALRVRGAMPAEARRVDALVKALDRVFRWRKMLDAGVCGTVEELARRERVSRGYMSGVLRLTLLAPDIVEAILDGRQPEGLRLEDLLEGFPVEWAKPVATVSLNLYPRFRSRWMSNESHVTYLRMGAHGKDQLRALLLGCDPQQR